MCHWIKIVVKLGYIRKSNTFSFFIYISPFQHFCALRTRRCLKTYKSVWRFPNACCSLLVQQASCRRQGARAPSSESGFRGGVAVRPLRTPLKADWLVQCHVTAPQPLRGPGERVRMLSQEKTGVPRFWTQFSGEGSRGREGVSCQKKSKGETFPSGSETKPPKLICSFPCVETLFPWHVYTAWQQFLSGAVDTPGHHFPLQGITLMPHAQMKFWGLGLSCNSPRGRDFSCGADIILWFAWL